MHTYAHAHIHTCTHTHMHTHKHTCAHAVDVLLVPCVCVSSPTSDGSAAAVVCSEEFVKRHGLEGQAVEIVAMEMVTDLPSTFNGESCMKMVGGV